MAEGEERKIINLLALKIVDFHEAYPLLHVYSLCLHKGLTVVGQASSNLL